MTAACAHCGLPVRGKKIFIDRGGQRAYFCCMGCKLASQMLAADGVDREKFLTTEIAPLNLEIGPAAEGGEEWVFNVPGMVCEACVPIVRRILDTTDGVASSRVNFLTGRATVGLSDPRARARVVMRLRRMGYDAVELDDQRDESAAALVRVSLGLFLAVDIMMLSIPEYLHAYAPGEEQFRLYLRLGMAVLTLPIILWASRAIFLQAGAAIFARRSDVTLLAAIGAAAAYLYSIYATATGGPHVYFETAAFLPVILTVGRAVEERAKRQAREAVLGLVDVLPREAVVLRGEREVKIAPEAIVPGDLTLLKAGGQAPCDGMVVAGAALLDEKMLTGESLPRWRGKGSVVRAGARVIAGEARVEAAAPLEASLLALVISSLDRSELYRGPRRLALDKVVAAMVPAVPALAALAAALAYLSGAGPGAAALRAMAVVLFACPCALSLAAPLARAVMIGNAAGMGVVVRDAEALEFSRPPDRLVVDKTGTLTLGAPTLADVRPMPGHDLDENALIALAASLDRGSSHPLADAVTRAAAERGLTPPEAVELDEVAGAGRTGTIAGKSYLFGNSRLFDAQTGESAVTSEISEDLTRPGLSVSHLAVKDGDSWRMLASFAFSDQLRPEAPAVIAEMRRMGIEPVLATGDLVAAARPVANACAITEVHAELSPDQKRDLVVELRRKGHTVWAIGDGINDAPALAAAALGIAMGRGARLAAEAAHLALADDRIERLPALIKLGLALSAVVRQNLAWATAYNAIGLPLAFLGLLQPVLSALAMMVSSLSVVLNSLRLRKNL